MKLTTEEEMMYDVMEALYNSGIPIDFKGSMVLKACLLENGYSNEVRHTLDIDANWQSTTPPTAEEMTQSLQNALDKSKIPLNVRLYRMYGEGRSAGFEFESKNSNEILFTMDMDVNRPSSPTHIYVIEGIAFRGVAIEQMLADKVSAVSSDKVFRRIKDVVDLYYISQVCSFDSRSVTLALKNSGRKLGDFHGFLHRFNDLKHAYEKFRFNGDAEKPPFETVYNTVKAYIKDIIPREKNRDMER